MQDIPSKFIIFVIFFIIFLYFLPIIYFGINDFFSPFLGESTDFIKSLWRSISFATISSLINVICAFFLAIFLYQIKPNSKTGQFLTILIVPILLGNITVVFLFKSLLYNTDFFSWIIQSEVLHFILLLLMQFWHFGIFFIYLLWLRIHSIPNKKIDYAKSVQLTKFEFYRDMVLPHVGNLVILIFFINFIFSFYEDAKNQLIFKGSEGTNTELISHCLFRVHKASSCVTDPLTANYELFGYGLFVFIILTLLFVVFYAGFKYLKEVFHRIQAKRKTKNSCYYVANETLSSIIAYFLVSLVLILPIYIVSNNLDLLFHSLRNLISNTSILFIYFMSFIAAILSALIAIIFSISSKIVFTNILNDFNKKSFLFFLFIFSLLLIPPTAITQLGFYWVSQINTNMYLLWILGHIVLTFPLLASFIVVVHFSLSQKELTYVRSINMNLKEIIVLNFFKRFYFEYIFTTLFALSLIWNDTIFNSAIDIVDSFSSKFKMFFIGRNTNQYDAYAYLILSLVITLLSLWIWKKIIKSFIKENNHG